MANQDKNDRKARIEAAQKSVKSADSRRNSMIVGTAALLGVLLIVAAAWKPVTDTLEKREFQGKDLAAIGASADSCQEVITKPSNGVMDHVSPGTPIDYEESPPAFGQHYDVWASMERKFYTDDRPDVGELVHNLEHGYTILWYDETAAADEAMMTDIRGLTAKFDGDNFRNKFKAVPWTEEDGDAFPEGQHIALTHWSAGGEGNTDQSKFVGVWQYCAEPSGEALETFMDTYPYTDSPEPMGG